MRKQKVLLLFAFVSSLSVFFYISGVLRILHQRPLTILTPEKEFYFVTTRTVDSNCTDLAYGNYCVNSLPGDAQRSNSSLGSLTLCTQGTVEFLQHVSVLCRRWGGPISVAVYTPPLDYQYALAKVDALQRCDYCVRHWVTWHFFGKKEPGNLSLYVSSQDFSIPWDCKIITQSSDTSKRKSPGLYPINVGRNLARSKANTPYVLSLDIELYPSTGVLPKFERMLRSSQIAAGDVLQVWVLPVFEVRSNFSAPETKFQLRKMYNQRVAISFHRYRCNVCHMIPNLTIWLNSDAEPKSELDESFEVLKVWKTVQRSQKYRLQYWEPFFIGTKEDPEFDIRLSWEGKQNKMQMAYEMCLRNYSFHIVENAFLVHAPGINIFNATKDKTRQIYVKENRKWMSIIKRDLINTYGLKRKAKLGC